MQKVISPSGIGTQKLWQNATWYRALALAERLESLRMQERPAPLTNQERAKQRLLRWKEQVPFNKGDYFTQRLALDGATEDLLLALLSEPIEVVQARSALPPAWLMRLITAFEEQGDATDAALLLTPQEGADHTSGFINTIRPLLTSGLERLQRGIQELVQNYSELPFEPTSVCMLLFSQLIGRLLPQMNRTIVLELNAARMQGRLQGDTPAERFQLFLAQLAQPEHMLPLLEEYAVLARYIVETIDRWVACGLELLTRLCADWQEIRAAFTPERDPGMLVDVQEGQGDYHRGGRSVTILTWSSGFRLVYKPRSMAVDVHFQELLDWMNTRGFQPPFRTLRILDKGTYGWVEFVSATSCSTKEEIERFYVRQGGYLALLYVLNANDFHFENLIAAGEHPILIDLETLLQPYKRATAEPGLYTAMDKMNQSVLHIGLLPQRMSVNEQAKGIDISGLGGQDGQMTPAPVTMWRGMGTDEMHVEREYVEIPPGMHRPQLQDQRVDASVYRDSILTGFRCACQLFRQYSGELLTDLLPRFSHDEIRYVLRPTHIYTRLLSDAFHPNMLRDALDRDRLFDRLWGGIEQKPWLSSVIAAERADLLAGDVPLFVTQPDSRNLVSSHGQIITDFFDIAGMEVVRERIQQLDEHDLERQLWTIQTSFDCMRLGASSTMTPHLQLHAAQVAVSSERLLRMAASVGDRLSALAFCQDDTAGWLGLEPLNESDMQIMPVNADLYNGTAGIAFFLAYLGLLTGEERFSTLARAALMTTRLQMKQLLDHPEYAINGLYNGLGGYIYLLSHLGTIWHEPELYQEAHEIAELLPGIIERDKLYDVIAGSAGCIAALLSLHAVAPSASLLAVARQCGDHLIAHAQSLQSGIGWSTDTQKVPLTGFAHGNAGIALNLLRLFEISGEERFRQAALAAWEYERSLFSSEHQNWPDLRTLPGEQPSEKEAEQFMVAWCHGAAGIGLARLASLEVINDAAVRAEIDAALATTFVRGFGFNHSLCHGDFGNLEALLIAAHILPGSRYEAQGQQLIPALLESIDEHGWVTGLPEGVESPGLMTGLAGTGYELLRIAAPERVPSVLLAEPPRDTISPK